MNRRVITHHYGVWKMNTNPPINTPPSDIIPACLHAIESSIDHFVMAQRNILEVAALVQESEAAEVTETNADRLPKTQPNNNEPLCISKVNYIAILSLEQLGIISPTQAQIDTLESVILLAMNPNGDVTKKTIDRCISGDTVARRMLLRKLKGIC